MKEINEAYQVLSDAKKKAVYDRFGQYSDNLADAAARGAAPGATYGGAPFDFSGFDWGSATTGGGAGSSFRDIFADLFGSTRAEKEPPRPQPQRGADIEMPLSMTPMRTPVLDPVTHTASAIKHPVLDPKTPSTRELNSMTPSAYWGDEPIWTAQHRSSKAGWATARRI